MFAGRKRRAACVDDLTELRVETTEPYDEARNGAVASFIVEELKKIVATNSLQDKYHVKKQEIEWVRPSFSFFAVTRLASSSWTSS